MQLAQPCLAWRAGCIIRACKRRNIFFVIFCNEMATSAIHSLSFNIVVFVGPLPLQFFQDFVNWFIFLQISPDWSKLEATDPNKSKRVLFGVNGSQIAQNTFNLVEVASVWYKLVQICWYESKVVLVVFYWFKLVAIEADGLGLVQVSANLVKIYCIGTV